MKGRNIGHTLYRIHLLSIRQEGQGKDNGYGTQVLALLENEALSVQTYEITYPGF